MYEYVNSSSEWTDGYITEKADVWVYLLTKLSAEDKLLAYIIV